jgi:hypothetical protein
MNKNFFYLTGMFRCGNTLLTSILNQNPNIYLTPNSLTPDILWRIYNLKNEQLYQEQKDYKSLKNVLKSVLHSYYKDRKEKYIIERGPWGTPANYDMLNEIGMFPAKFIVLIRPLKEIIASFCRIVKPDSPIGYIEYLLNEEIGPIGKGLLAYKNLKEKEKNNLLKIEYKNLCNNTEDVIKNIYSFLDIPFYKKHYYCNLKQVDSTTEQTIIRTENIKIEYFEYDKWVPKYFNEKIKEYENTYIYS